MDISIEETNKQENKNNGLPILKNFIHGEYVETSSEYYFDLISPVTGKSYAQSPQSNQKDVDMAYDSAKEAFKIWGRSTPSARQKALLAFAEVIEKNSDRLVEAQSRNTGQIKHLIAQEEVATAVDQIRFFAGAARMLEGRASAEYMEGFTSTIRREPVGIVGQVTPWNYPLMMAVWKIAPALAAGNTVVLKPSETTPESTLLLAELAAPFFPRGALNIVLGDVQTGIKVVSHKVPALVSITGSVRAGLEVAELAARNLTRTHLELGGKAPVVIFEDANLEAVVPQVVTAAYFNAGQDCTAATRVLVAESIYDQFISRLLEAVQDTHFGDPDDENALYGALNNERQLERVKGFIERLPKHAKVLTGGRQADRPGYYFEPTVIAGLQQQDEAIQQEIFGPVMTVQTFSDEEDAIQKANGVRYGLSASVWTQNHSRAQRLSQELDFGTVWINTHIPLTAEMPHGGFKHSGYGKDLSAYGFEEYTRVKHVMSFVESL